MTNSNANSNLGVFGSISVFVFGLLFFGVVLLHADLGPPSVVSSKFCPKTRNSSLCRTILKPAGRINALFLANYTISIAQISAAEGLRHARQLAAETEDPVLKNRYSECSRRFELVVKGIEEGKKALANGGYDPLTHATGDAVANADGCLFIFKDPPLEPSTLPKKAKNVGDIMDITFFASYMLTGDEGCI